MFPCKAVDGVGVEIELPISLPLVFAGIRTSAVYVVATATLAAIAGGGGLGDIIVNQASYKLAGVIGKHGFRHRATILAVALSPDGKRAVSSDADGVIHGWDLAARD